MESKFNGDASPAITEAMERATKVFKLCPNRVWAIGRNLQGWETKLPQLIPPVEDGETRMKIVGHQGHEHCTFDFCEYSMLNFTNAKQRHERPSCATSPCDTIKDKFSAATLNEAAHAGKPTAWRLDGMSMVEDLESFMAISHVWSDGTGAGGWPDGEVNECLYSFFTDIASRFGCEGIWWDTVCIPKNKVARAKAIGNMQQNYENAQITLVHDCYIRQLEWIDAESACLAIIMSPWFSRGWTSLELANSKRVKIIFKGSVIKDLDTDILSKSAADSPRHKIATGVIVNLRRKRIETVNDLLAVLASRSTSWPRDMAVIAALLVGINIPTDANQQGIYKTLLHHFGDIRQGHLFHRSATMSGGFNWCPTNLLDMPMASAATKSGRDRLEIDRWGRAMGEWRIIKIDSVPLDNYILEDAHPLTRVKLALALKCPNDHLLLAESTGAKVSRALVVKCLSQKAPELLMITGVGDVVLRFPEEEFLEDSPRILSEGSSDESSDDPSEQRRYVMGGRGNVHPTACCYQFVGPVHFNRPLTRIDVWGDDVLRWPTAQICIGDTPETHKDRAEIEREIHKLREEYRELASPRTTLAGYRRLRSVLWEIETLKRQLPRGDKRRPRTMYDGDEYEYGLPRSRYEKSFPESANACKNTEGLMKTRLDSADCDTMLSTGKLLACIYCRLEMPFS
jgi:hypothetical protein